MAEHTASYNLMPARFDMKHVVAYVNTALNPSHSKCELQFSVTSLSNGMARLTFDCPDPLFLTCLASVLENVATFLRRTTGKARSVIAENTAISADEMTRREKYLERQEKFVCSHFDKLIKQGRGVNEAISMTNTASKSKFPNLSYDSVKNIIRQSGRLRKGGERKGIDGFCPSQLVEIING